MVEKQNMSIGKIGVRCKPHQREIAAKFFQLFMTPWEFAKPGKNYAATISTQQDDLNLFANVTFYFSADEIAIDQHLHTTPTRQEKQRKFIFQQSEIPVYNSLSAINGPGSPILMQNTGGKAIGNKIDIDGQTIFRIGYDLFEEIAHLLTIGQPPENALVPTLDIHIDILRQAIISCHIPWIEIPPTPAEFDFMGCLTHDIDFAGIRVHKFDRTVWGFIYRSLFGSPIRCIQGKISIKEMLKNWGAVCLLPFIYNGTAKDIWAQFDQYAELEAPFHATYFIIPNHNQPGTALNNVDNSARAVKYPIETIQEQLISLQQSGHEIGVHGINAWHNAQAGTAEKETLLKFANTQNFGIRMHWLYWHTGTPKTLEQAGYSYDSTRGYNDAIGYLNGTGQPFIPPGAAQILELPMHIQDTSMFYPNRMNLTPSKAKHMCSQLIKNAKKYGGVLTLSWHGRSLAPERQWGRFYNWLLSQIQKHKTWIGSAKEIITWFRYRQSIQFETIENTHSKAVVRLYANLPPDGLTGILRFYHQGKIENIPLTNDQQEQNIHISYRRND